MKWTQQQQMFAAAVKICGQASACTQSNAFGRDGRLPEVKDDFLTDATDEEEYFQVQDYLEVAQAALEVANAILDARAGGKEVPFGRMCNTDLAGTWDRLKSQKRRIEGTIIS